MKRVLVLTDTLPWGHRSIAKAIFGALKIREKELDIKVDFAEVKAETGLGGDMYTFVYRYLPITNRLAHKLAENEGFREVFTTLSDFNLPNLKKTVQHYHPDLIICAYFFHSHSLVRWRKQEGLNWKLWTVAADPWTINPVSFLPEADKTLVYDEIGLQEAIKFGVDADKVMITGWWTREEMYQQYDQKKVRKKLGVIEGSEVIFLGGGSLGTNSLARLLPVVMMIKQKLTLIVNTGTDKLAFNMVEEFKKMLTKIKREDQVKIINLGWIDNMAEVLSAVDIVFGKAGPNFLFDVVACGKPIVAITHIGGQEDGNIDLIKKKKLGWVKEKPGEAGEFLIEYLSNPDKYKNIFRESIKAEAEKNKRTWDVIGNKIKDTR